MRRSNKIFTGLALLGGISFLSIALSVNPSALYAAAPTNTDNTGITFAENGIKSSSDYYTLSGSGVSASNGVANFTNTGALGIYAPYNKWQFEFTVTAKTALTTDGYIGVAFGSSSQITSSSTTGKMIYFGHAGNNNYPAFVSQKSSHADLSRIGWVTPFQYQNTSTKIKIVANNSQMKVYMDSGTGYKILAAENNGLEVLNGGDAYINYSQYTGYFGIVTAGATNFSVSSINVQNLDPNAKPREIEDKTTQTSYNYEPGGEAVRGLVVSGNSGSTFSVESDTSKCFNIDSTSGAFTFTPTSSLTGTHSVVYKITNDTLTKTGTLTFNQKTHVNAPLLKKSSDKREVYNYTPANFPKDTMPITGWVAPQSALGHVSQNAYDEFKEAGLNVAIASSECLGKGSSTTADSLKSAEYAEKAGVYYLANVGKGGDSSKYTSNTEAYNRSAHERTEENLRSVVEDEYETTGKTLFQTISQYKSFIGVITRDEPGSKFFEFQPKYRALLNKGTDVDGNVIGSNYMNYCNLLPIAARSQQLINGVWDGADAVSNETQYQAYLDAYSTTVNSPSMCFDNYAEVNAFPNLENRHFLNMKMFANQAKKNHVPFYAFNLITGHMGYRIPTTSDINWTVNTSLAYGAKGIQWFCYEHPHSWTDEVAKSQSWYSNGGSFIDLNGNKTAQYYIGQKINRQIARMDEVLMNSTQVDLQYCNSGVSDFTNSGANPFTGFRELESVSTTGNLLIGCFDHGGSTNGGKTALYLVNNDNVNSLTGNLKFNQYVEANLYLPENDAKFNGSNLSIALNPGEGMLVELTNYEGEDVAIDASKAEISGINEEYAYTGNPITPTPTVTYAGQTLTNNEHYTVSYTDNTSSGTATCKVTFKGRYKGEVSKTFKISGKPVVYTDPTVKTNLTFNNSNQVLINAGSVSEGGTMKYSLDGGTTWVSDVSSIVGKDAKTYTVSYKVFANSGYVDSEVKTLQPKIAKADISFTGTLNQSANYTGSPLNPTAPTCDQGLSVSLNEIRDSNNVVVTEAKNIGTYKFKYVVNESTNYKGGSYTVTFTINNPQACEYVDPIAKEDLIYTGTSQALCDPGSVTTGGDMMYSLDQGVNWSTNIPIGLEAGTYTVSYYAKSNTPSYSDGPTKSFNVIIDKKQVVITGEEEQRAVYNGEVKSPVAPTISDGKTANLVITKSGQIVQASDVSAKGTYIYTYTVNDDKNYAGAQFVITFEIGDKFAPEYIAPKAKTDLSYTGTAQELIVAGSVTKGGKMLYSLDRKTWSENIPTGTQTGKYTVYYKIEETDTYKALSTKTISVEIKKNLLSFVDTYKDVPAEENKSAYTKMKQEYFALTENERIKFQEQDKYQDARTNYEAWAKANHDNVPYEEDYSYQNYEAPTPTYVIVAVCGIFAFSVGSIVALIVPGMVKNKKKK